MLNLLVLFPVQRLEGQGFFPTFSQSSEIIFIDDPSFSRGDCNADGHIDIGDPIDTLGFLFGSIGSLPCNSSCDSNDDAQIDIADPIVILSLLFSGGDPRPPPTLPICAADPTPDDLDCNNYFCP